jgi:adenosylmethionine-8-amino-7-oxononanoate aminotransferase
MTQVFDPRRDEAGRSERLKALDHAHVWHPFTQMQGYLGEEQLVIERAEGHYLFDSEGRSYLDGVSSLWVTVHGHRRKEIDDAVRTQLDKVAHTTLLGLSSPPSIELAARLAALAPHGLQRVFYSDSGSTAVEVALKMAFQYFRQTGRPERRRFLALGEAYHGDTLGAVSVGGMTLFHDVFHPLLFEVERIPAPHCYRCPFGKRYSSCERFCAEEAGRTIEALGESLAAVIVEPLVQGAAGMITQPPGYLSRLRTACDRVGALLICDEVATGFGRTGTLFACTQEGVRPDLLCLAKGLTGGYLPLAATLATEEIYAAFLGAFEEKRTFFHGHTYTGNPLACAAALASLDVFEKDGVIAALPGKVARLAAGLEAVRRLAHVGDVRQKGLMVGIELVKDRETREEYPYADRMGHRVILGARRRGVMLRPLGNVVVLVPPLSITPEEIDTLARATAESIAEVT